MNFHSRLVRIPALILGGLTVAALFSLLFGWVVMLLWNAVIPDVFGLRLIGYWQAVGLLILSHLLFKAGAHRHPHRPFFRPRRTDLRPGPLRTSRRERLRDPREKTSDSQPAAE